MPGAFLSGKYQSQIDPTKIYGVRVQPETLSLVIASVANAFPTESITEVLRAKVSKTRREYGQGVAKAYLEFTDALPEGYDGEPVAVPLLTQAIRAVAVTDATGSYLGASVRVIGVSSENRK